MSLSLTTWLAFVLVSSKYLLVVVFRVSYKRALKPDGVVRVHVDQGEEDIALLDGLEDVLRFPSGKTSPANMPGSKQRADFNNALDGFFNSIPTLAKAERIKAGKFAETAEEELEHLKNATQSKKMSSRKDENFERDMDSWMMLSFIQNDILKVLRLRQVSLKFFDEGYYWKKIIGVQGFTPQYTTNQARREVGKNTLWVILSSIAFYSGTGQLAAGTSHLAAQLNKIPALHNVLTNLPTGQQAVQLGDVLALFLSRTGSVASAATTAHTAAGIAIQLADKLAGEEAKTLVTAGPANALHYWPDAELGHLYAGYAAVNSLICSILAERNSRPVLTKRVVLERGGDRYAIRSGSLLGSTSKFGPMLTNRHVINSREQKVVKAVWQKKVKNKTVVGSAWIPAIHVSSAARYTAKSQLRIYDSRDGSPFCVPKAEFVYPGETFYIVAKDCKRCGLGRLTGKCLWKLGDGRGWILRDSCGSVSNPMASEREVEHDLQILTQRGGELLGNREAGKLRNANLSTGATALRALVYTVLGLASVAFALQAMPALAFGLLGGAALSFLVSVAPLLKAFAIASSAVSFFDSAASAIIESRGLDTISKRSFLAQAALAHWERHLWDIQDCDITDPTFCSPKEICLRGGAFFRRSHFSPVGRCIPGAGSRIFGKCLIHKDCQTGYCHVEKDVEKAARAANASSDAIVAALLGTCRIACKLDAVHNASVYCERISDQHMFGLLRFTAERPDTHDMDVRQASPDDNGVGTLSHYSSSEHGISVDSLVEGSKETVESEFSPEWNIEVDAETVFDVDTGVVIEGKPVEAVASFPEPESCGLNSDPLLLQE